MSDGNPIWMIFPWYNIKRMRMKKGHKWKFNDANFAASKIQHKYEDRLLVCCCCTLLSYSRKSIEHLGFSISLHIKWIHVSANRVIHRRRQTFYLSYLASCFDESSDSIQVPRENQSNPYPKYSHRTDTDTRSHTASASAMDDASLCGSANV